MEGFYGYRVLILTFLSGLLAQSIKVVSGYLKERRLDLRRLVEPGGMPSSHSSAAMALTTSVAIYAGLDSMMFVIALFFSFVIMYEAAGLRRAAGIQAQILNLIVDEIYTKRRLFHGARLRELLGHTPLEVILGAIMGIIFALAFC